MYDIVIIGAGPAGSTLARLLDNKYKVLILDKRDLIENKNTSSSNKCCGGLLAPDAQYMLAKFGLGLPKEILVGPQIFTVRTIDIDNNLERYYQRNYVNIDREKFDRWLVSLIPKSVDTKFKCVFKDFEILGNKIKVNYFQDNKKYSVETNILVGADGGFSKIRKLLTNSSTYDSIYVSVQEWYEIDKPLPYFSAIFDSNISDFYSWTIPKENSLIIGSALKLENNCISKFNLLKQNLSSICGFNLNKITKKEGSYLFRPKNVNQLYLGNECIALIGEAGGFISPSSAEGISYAFRSALNLSRAINKNYKNFMPLYKLYSKKLKTNIFLKNCKSPFMYNKNLRKLIMKSRILSMKITH